MNGEAGVRINLSVDSMKHHMVQYLTEHALDLPQMVEAELDKILRHPEAIVSAIERQIGDDLRVSINNEVTFAIQRIFYRTEIREGLEEAVIKAIRAGILADQKGKDS